MSNRHGQALTAHRGFSITELMVAVAIGLLVMAGVLGLFVTNKGIFASTTRAAELQENGQFALGYLLQDLRNAYFFGETHYPNLTTDDAQAPQNADLDDPDRPNCSGSYAVYSFQERTDPPAAFPIHGATASNRTAIGCIADALTVTGIPSDVLVIKSALPDAETSTANLILGNVYIASNFQMGYLRQFTADFAAPDLPNIKYWPYRFSAYYIRDSSPTDGNPPTLSRMVLEWDDTDGMGVIAEDLVEGVEGMRLLYGVESDTDGDPPAFVPEDEVTDWSKVIAIRVYLLLRNTEPDRSYDDTMTYHMGDVTVTATGGSQLSQDGVPLRHFRRQVITTTVRLRNRQYIELSADNI